MSFILFKKIFIIFSVHRIDAISPDVTVIEDDLNLDELMRQKELLQARLVAYMESEEEESTLFNSNVITDTQPKTCEFDIILLDDSSAEHSIKKDKYKKRVRIRSPSRERKVLVTQSRPDLSKERKLKEKDNVRSSLTNKDVENRYKEDLRTEINRENERIYRQKEKNRYERGHRSLQNSDPKRSIQENSIDRRHEKNPKDFNREKGRFYKEGVGKCRIEETKDMFKDSLSEGLKKVKNTSSSESDINDIDINEDEEDEEKIIEKRRKQREELMKVSLTHNLDINIVSGVEPIVL